MESMETILVTTINDLGGRGEKKMTSVDINHTEKNWSYFDP